MIKAGIQTSSIKKYICWSKEVMTIFFLQAAEKQTHAVKSFLFVMDAAHPGKTTGSSVGEPYKRQSKHSPDNSGKARTLLKSMMEAKLIRKLLSFSKRKKSPVYLNLHISM